MAWLRKLKEPVLRNGRSDLCKELCQKYADLIRAAKKMSEILDLPVVNPIMTPDLAYAGFKNYTKCGPLHFLNLVDNAEMVVTNSFHGTIFSALFGTPFISIKSDIFDKYEHNLQTNTVS